MNPLQYSSRGKLLISGEYLVLYGALAFAVPTRFGQKLLIKKANNDEIIYWKTFMQGRPWFHARFDVRNLNIVDSNNIKSAVYIQKALIAAQQLRPAFLKDYMSWEVESHIDFNTEWGLGSSSSLVSNIAYWAEADPFLLHTKVSQGSGYDVACARAEKPILFENCDGRRLVTEVDFNPPFSGNIYFVYLGRKMDSQVVVHDFLGRSSRFYMEVQKISDISQQMTYCNDIKTFGNLMVEHEEILSGVLGKQTLKNDIFRDFGGEIKSLGAWGGDFAMALWPAERHELEHYFSRKNLNVVFSLKEMMYDKTEYRQNNMAG